MCPNCNDARRHATHVQHGDAIYITAVLWSYQLENMAMLVVFGRYTWISSLWATHMNTIHA